MKRPWAQIFPLSATDWLLNILLLQGPFGAPDATLVYWSLTIEVQFYLLMMICLIFPRRRSIWLIGLSVGYCIWIWRPALSIAGTPLAYWPEFACGIAAYIAHHPTGFLRGSHWLIWGLSLIAALIGFSHGTSFLIGHDGEFITPMKQLFCLTCGLIVWQIRGIDWIVSRTPILRALSAVGLVSYSLYLTHVPIGTRVFNLVGKSPMFNGLGFFFLGFLAIFIELAAGLLFYWYCEVPWLHAKTLSESRLTAALPKSLEPAGTSLS